MTMDVTDLSASAAAICAARASVSVCSMPHSANHAAGRCSIGPLRSNVATPATGADLATWAGLGATAPARRARIASDMDAKNAAPCDGSHDHGRLVMTDSSASMAVRITRGRKSIGRLRYL